MQPLLLLHGAIGAKQQMLPLAKKLAHKYDAHLLNFTGHGGETIPPEPFSIRLFAEQVIAYMDRQQISSIDIFGYSMGGYVGMWIARHFPGRINKLVTLATKFYWDEPVAAREVKFLDPEKIEQKLPAFAAELQQRHLPQDWKAVLKKTKDMLLTMGEQNPLQLNEYKKVDAPCLILLGEKDQMITSEETVAVYEQLPHAEMQLIPGTPHPIEQVDVNVLASLITGFLKES